jgi:hypothetical protein
VKSSHHDVISGKSKLVLSTDECGIGIKSSLSKRSFSSQFCKCLVTGASPGIGQTTCQVLSGYGAKLVGSGRNEETLVALKAEGSIQFAILLEQTVPRMESAVDW